MDKSNFNTIEDVRKAGSHLSLEDRGMIQALHRQGYSLRRIAAPTLLSCMNSGAEHQRKK